MGVLVGRVKLLSEFGIETIVVGWMGIFDFNSVYLLVRDSKMWFYSHC